jgi:N-acetylglutamate synthase-like GNAT family acetyltransferase
MTEKIASGREAPADRASLPIQRWLRGDLEVSTDPARLDVEMIHRFLDTTYWAKGRSLADVRRSIAHSMPFGLYEQTRQIGFARVTSDWTVIAFVNDVFVLPDWRRRGLGLWLMDCVVAHPELQGLRRWMLATNDMHALYRKVGFSALATPETLMERLGLSLES